MKKTLTAFALLCLALPALAQKHELSFTVGTTLSDLHAIDVTSGQSYQLTYAYKFLEREKFSLLAEGHMLGNPKRELSGVPTVPKEISSLYIMPGIRIQARQGEKVSPYATIGGGYVRYWHSDTLVSGAANPAVDHQSRGGITFGAGLDVDVKSGFAIRGEARDYFTGPPTLNEPKYDHKKWQHNIVASIGVVYRFDKLSLPKF